MQGTSRADVEVDLPRNSGLVQYEDVAGCLVRGHVLSLLFNRFHVRILLHDFSEILLGRVKSIRRSVNPNRAFTLIT
jgi:hypothetical protein